MKKIVYILSSSYAGSHYLSLLLGSHSKTKHVGELRKLVKSDPGESKEVDLAKDSIFEGLTPDCGKLIYDRLFERLPAGTEVLIDTSKRVERWASRFLGMDEYERYYIHLIRDPRAMLRRWKLNAHFTKNFRLKRRLIRHNRSWLRDLAFAGEDTLFAYRWVMENQRIQSFVTRNQLNNRIVSYRDLAVDPGKEIERLMAWIGLEYEPEQLEYWNFDHIGTTKLAYSDVRSKEQCRIDLRWQEELPFEQQQSVLANQHVQDFAQDLGLSYESDGLTRG